MQGQPFSRLVLVESGCIKLTRLSPNGNEVILGMRGPHEILDLPMGPRIGEHTCTGRAVVACKALTWDWIALDRLTGTTPQVSRNICGVLLRQLHELQERYHEMSAENVGRRLACTLIRLDKQFGIPTDRGSEILISRQELAQMVGATLFTVSRLISKWGSLGLIVPRREAILMLDAKGLDALSCAEHPVHDNRPSLPQDRRRARAAIPTLPPVPRSNIPLPVFSDPRIAKSALV